MDQKKMSDALPAKACPLGYLIDEGRRWARDPDPSVRALIESIFQTAAERAQREEQIQRHHRKRLAVVYVRSATLRQTAPGQAGLDYRRAQRVYAYRWGWPPEAVQVIDDDIGRPGTASESRSGFQRLCRLIARGRVGLVLVSDLSRLSRSVMDLCRFRELCRRKDTLVAVDGRVINFHHPEWS